jgi:hypothetical protein
MTNTSDANDVDLMDTFPVKDGQTVYDAIVKLKLVHAHGQSVLVPDILALPSDQVWLQPYFFTPPILSFYKGKAYAQFTVDIADGERLLVGLTNDRHIGTLPDGSHVYRCEIAGSADLLSKATGACRARSNGFDLRLFHHTTPATLDLIKSSSVLRGSVWNYQGTTKLTNVSYAYLTSLPAIRSIIDLEKIAMASNGTLYMLLDDHTPPAGMIPIQVYREQLIGGQLCRCGSLAMRSRLLMFGNILQPWMRCTMRSRTQRYSVLVSSLTKLRRLPTIAFMSMRSLLSGLRM